MKTIEKSIFVDVPLSVAYNQWTQFEEFPHFMQGVQDVQQLDDTRLQWNVQIAGKTEEWEAEIYEQTPDTRIAWRSISGAQNSGQILFYPITYNRTEIVVQLHYDPRGFAEKLGSALGVVDARVTADLQRFKEFIERRGVSTGEWRGAIHSRHVMT